MMAMLRAAQSILKGEVKGRVLVRPR